MHKLADFIQYEHSTLRPHVELIRVTADTVGEVPLPILRDLTNAVLGFLLRELMPHAREEREVLYKALEQATQAPGSTATMNREHLEVSKLADQLGDLRRVLYGLYALINLHFAKEGEIYSDILEHRLSTTEKGLLVASLSHCQGERQCSRFVPLAPTAGNSLPSFGPSIRIPASR